jgi:dipeptidyl aminopeptidase/acylaminoacyl peptidase
VTRNAPPFLLIQGDKDEYIPFTESTNLQTALRNAGVKCDIIRIPNGTHGTGAWYAIPGVPDWERQMTEWLNTTLRHNGEVGEGIRERQPRRPQI